MSADDEPPAWIPQNAASVTTCQNCDTVVTKQFARVFGDNDDIVHRCGECTPYRDLKQNAGADPKYERGDSTLAGYSLLFATDVGESR